MLIKLKKERTHQEDRRLALWLATELNDARRYIFPALWRNNPGFNDPERIAAGIKEWNHCITILESQLQRIALTLADVVLRLSVNRWKIMA